MKIDLLSRMRAVKEVACFTTTDMARWFGVKRMTMVTWLHAYATPLEYKLRRLEQDLLLLERITTSRTFADRVPVPPSVSQADRAHFLDTLKTDGIVRFSQARPAGRGNKVLGKNKQKQEGNAGIRSNA